MRPPSRPEGTPTILLVRPRLIGDVLLTTPSIRALRRHWPAARILYLVEATAAPVVAANPLVDETMVIRHRRGWPRLVEDLRMARRLRRLAIDLAIDLHGGPRSAWLTFASRARVRVGYDGAGRRWMYTRRIARPRGYGPRHSALNAWDLASAAEAALGGDLDPERDRIEFPVDAGARASAAARLAALGVGPDDRVIALHAAAGNEFRRWPESSFAAVAAALADPKAGRVVVVIGSAHDAASIARVVLEARALSPASRVVAAVDWPLVDVRALMDRAALFIGGDSGPMHIAAASDVPIVALFGPTLPVHWAPWRPASLAFAAIEPGPLACRPCDQRACAPGDFRCLRETAPERVIDAARRLLERD